MAFHAVLFSGSSRTDLDEAVCKFSAGLTGRRPHRPDRQERAEHQHRHERPRPPHPVLHSTAHAISVQITQTTHNSPTVLEKGLNNFLNGSFPKLIFPAHPTYHGIVSSTRYYVLMHYRPGRSQPMNFHILLYLMTTR